MAEHTSMDSSLTINLSEEEWGSIIFCGYIYLARMGYLNFVNAGRVHFEKEEAEYLNYFPLL